jgi:hypothetical protein
MVSNNQAINIIWKYIFSKTDTHRYYATISEDLIYGVDLLCNNMKAVIYLIICTYEFSISATAFAWLSSYD